MTFDQNGTFKVAIVLFYLYTRRTRRDAKGSDAPQFQ